jgi:hypothetical protein
VSVSEPPELPELPEEASEVVYRRPAWVEPPADVVPGIVPVELLLAHTDTDAVLVTDLRAYPTGLEFALTARPHPDQLQQRRHNPDRPHRFRYRDLWLELRFANGQTASNHPGSWPRTFETEQPDPPFLYRHGRAGVSAAGAPATGCGACPRPGRWPSYAPGRPASSQPQVWRSTPAWCWRRPIEPPRSGRRPEEAQVFEDELLGNCHGGTTPGGASQFQAMATCAPVGWRRVL